jgi:hypothetical protein
MNVDYGIDEEEAIVGPVRPTFDESTELLVYPKSCSECNSDSGWVWIGREIRFPNDYKVHKCRCGNSKVAVFEDDHSFFRDEEPIFFERSGHATPVEDRYRFEYPLASLKETDCLCDYPNCPKKVPTMAYSSDGIIVFVYLKGNCSMQLSDDGDRWLRLDFCEDHASHGEYYFIVSDARDQARPGDKHIVEFQQRIMAQQKADDSRTIRFVETITPELCLLAIKHNGE